MLRPCVKRRYPAAPWVAIGVAAAVPCDASGDDLDTTMVPDDTWSIEVAPYLWPVSLDGDAVIAGNRFAVDAPFTDTLDESDSLIGLMGHLEVGRGGFSVFFTPAYSRVGYEGVATESGPADIVARTGWYEFGGAAALVDKALGEDRRWLVLGLVGGRVTTPDVEVELDAGGGADGDQTWVEPFVGARTRVDLGRSVTLNLRGDVGGSGPVPISRGRRSGWSAGRSGSGPPTRLCSAATEP